MQRVLVVDDDPGVRLVLCEALSMAGFEVEEAADGVAALRQVESFKPDLVVLDIVMPEKEGIETIMDLRRADKRVPILAMSGGGAAGPDGYLVPAVKLGADRSLAKPFRIDVFLEVVRDLLKG